MKMYFLPGENTFIRSERHPSWSQQTPAGVFVTETDLTVCASRAALGIKNVPGCESRALHNGSAKYRVIGSFLPRVHQATRGTLLVCCKRVHVNARRYNLPNVVPAIPRDAVSAAGANFVNQ